MSLLLAVLAVALIVFLGLLALKVTIVLCIVIGVLILLFGAGFSGFRAGRGRH
jgi:hypothetical protein